ncbi:PREDICTED: transmembrane and TPR repeat-containing protein CG5038 [Drosophila arizonae]|uniref:dolichyl-phosphate-mannose--protein mannosyltransferase n=1 Tax=Drosophila arizonae TaxID=7263 RepID=A0ABM1PZA9_DROAR|nr:PREDICTED: transmembrane and TPR repeat-containing protein CG5038 [Drosophila arizonae]
MASLDLRQSSTLHSLVCQSILVLLCLVCYGYGGLSGAKFVFDDTVAIVKNKNVNSLPTNWTAIFSHDFWGAPLLSADSHKSFRPLTTLMFHYEYALLGLNAAHMKFLNLLLHCVNTLLMWRLVRSLYVEDIDIERWATLSAALFAAHPVHTEAVSGVVGRAELMFGLIHLLCLLLTVASADKPGGSSVILILLLTAVGMLFKESAITIPLCCIMLDYFQNGTYMLPLKLQQRVITSRLRYLCYICGMLSLLLLRLWWQNFEAPEFKPVDNPIAHNEQLLTRGLSQQYLYVVNFWLMLCPQWLCFDWALGCINLVTSIWDMRLQGVIAFYSFLIVSLMNFRRLAGLMLGLALMVIPFLPASGIIRVGFVIAERTLYVPSIGFCLVSVYGFLYCYKNYAGNRYCRVALQALLMLLFAVFMLRTRQRAAEWLNEEQLFSSALQVCPNNAKVHYNIARLATDNGNSSRAFHHYLKAVELYPEYESALMNLGNLYREYGQLETAEKYIRAALAAYPAFPVAWMNLGIVQSAQKKYDQALDSYRQALKYRSDYAVCYYNMGNLFLEQHQYGEALHHWQHAVAINPRQPKAWANILTMLDNRGMYEDALRISAQALTQLPNEPSILFIRANVLGKLKHYLEAEALYKQVIELEPRNMLYHTNLGVLYHRWDKLEEAIECYQTAISINSSRATTARDNLGKLLKRLNRETPKESQQ